MQPICQPAPVFLRGKFYGQRSLVDYSPWGHKESDMTEPLSIHVYVHLNDTHQFNQNYRWSWAFLIAQW